MVPGAGLEPARLAAGDFESLCDFNRGVACSLILGALNCDLKALFYGYRN